jgi:uncharacterized membrane protein
MTRSPTPLFHTVSRCLPAVRSVLEVSGTVTVLWAASLIRPASVEAQAIGTMQVVAQVTPADASWEGLAAAQKAAREFATARTTNEPRRTDLSLIQIELVAAVSSHSARPQLAISIQHLRN